MTRVLSGAVLLLLAIGGVWFSPPLYFLALAEALLLLACVEYAKLAKASGLQVPFIISWAASAITCATFAAADWVGPLGSLSMDVGLMASLLAIATVTIVGWKGGRDALALVSASFFPALYLGVPIGAMFAVREARGPEGLFLMMLTVFVSDTAQYYTGRAFGRRLLAPTISPKKTIEGAIGGFLFGGAFLATVGAWWLPSVPIVFRVFLGVAIVAFGIIGDLFESMLKRSAGVKDSSTLIPGHGGILDRIDALLFAAPVYYIALKYLP